MTQTLRGVLVVVFLACLPATPLSGSSCQTGPDYFDYGPHRDNPEAEQLAMHLTGAIRAPDEEYERILGDLATVRGTYPILQSVVDDPDYSPDELLVKLDPELDLTDYEELNVYYQVIAEENLFGDWYKLTFCDNVNAPVLGSIYAQLSEVLFAEPNSLIGTDDRITISVVGDVYRYTIVDGFHDCFDGCDCERTWIVAAEGDGSISLLFYSEQGAPWCVFDDTACCLSAGTCLVSEVGWCLDQGGAPLDFNAVCENDHDGDGVDARCGDECPNDPEKTQPGLCGCSVPDTDSDADSSPDCHDCAPDDPEVYPDAPEINDGLDNQCPGDHGFGVIDEISGTSGFLDPGSKDEFSWPPQQGATLYQVARSPHRDFGFDCTLHETAGTAWPDPEQPGGGVVLHYLVRALEPNTGSWGQDSTGSERVNVCP